LISRRAAAQSSGDILTRHHLGLARRATGDDAGALSASTKVLQLSHDAFVSRLQRAEIYERLGRKGEALRLYFRRDARRAECRGQWRNRQTTPPSLQPLVSTACSFVNEGRRQLFEETLTLSRRNTARQPGSASSNACASSSARWSLATSRASAAALMYFPGLPTSPYLDRGLFPVAERWSSNERDPQRARSDPAARVPERSRFSHRCARRENLRGAAPKWNGYYFFRHGERARGKSQSLARGRRRPSRSHR